MFRSSIWTIISARYLTPTPPRPHRPNGHLHLTTYNLTDKIYTPTGIASAERKVGDRERTRNELAGYTVYAFFGAPTTQPRRQSRAALPLFGPPALSPSQSPSQSFGEPNHAGGFKKEKEEQTTHMYGVHVNTAPGPHFSECVCMPRQLVLY